ncbi:ATP-binding protein [Bacteroides xylanisolvens]|uniref:tetratricopeptide repeat-containing sensor histidine kinase n=1 Tax=Bacteroides xylanisolvens TaxID=371601 RepID=UPI0036F2991D
MKKAVYISFIINLLVCIPLHSKDRISEHLYTLQHLINANLAYDSIAPIDSIIIWEQQLSPILEQENQTELFFRIKQLLVHVHSLHGNIGQAIDEARLMYEKAETLKYDLGIALSNTAIGDAYYCSNMSKEAIDAYKEAILQPVSSSEGNYYKEMAILHLKAIFIRERNPKEAKVYREMLLKSDAIHTNRTILFFHYCSDAAYYIMVGELQKAQDSFHEAEKIYDSCKEPYYYSPLLCSRGLYYEAIGENELALSCYDNVLQSIKQKMQSISYLQVSYLKADLLAKTGNPQEAARLYDKISHITDSIASPSYTHRINSLRASYQESRMKVENKIEHNRIFMGGILIGTVILAVIIYLALHILKQNKKIAESKKLLEQSRLNTESAMHAKSLFLSNMSHEIRTPLSALSGFSNLLTDQKLDTETRRQCSDVIQQNSDLLLKLINDVIDLTNLEVGKMKFSFGYHDAIAVCNNVIDTVNKVKQTRAELRFKTPLTSLQLYTDDSRLQQLLINLLINATKFTAEGSITLEVGLQSDEYAFFSVTDTGCGIPLEKQANIFSRFEKLNETAQGSGLGLSICQLIIERIGGKIWIDPAYTGGCRFCFTHPVRPVEERKEEQA